MGKNTFNTFGLREAAKGKSKKSNFDRLREELASVNEENKRLATIPEKKPKKVEPPPKDDDDDEPEAPRRIKRIKEPPPPPSEKLTVWPPVKPPEAYNLVLCEEKLYRKNPSGAQPYNPNKTSSSSSLSTSAFGNDPLVAWIMNGRNEDVGQASNLVVLPDEYGMFPQNVPRPLPPAPDSNYASLLDKRPMDQFKGAWLSQNPVGATDEDAEWRRWLFNGVDDAYKAGNILKFPPIKIKPK